MTEGKAKEFPSPTMAGAWQCIWNEENNELVEFIPPGYKLVYGEHAALYVPQDDGPAMTTCSHFMVEYEGRLSDLQRIAHEYELVHRFRAKFGGPLYEVWLEENLLVEFFSPEITSLA